MCHRTGNIAGPVWIVTSPDHQKIRVGSLGHEHRTGISFGELQLPVRLRKLLIEDAPDSSAIRRADLLLRQPAVVIRLG
jgi:hypothetical protein